MNRFEDEVERALRGSADTVGPDQHPVSLDAVRGRARGIRRRRAAGSVLATAAVVGLAIGVTSYVVDERDTGTSIANTPSPAPTSLEPVEVELTTRVESAKEAAGIPYVYQGAMTLPDGSSIEVDHDYRTFAAWGEGYAAIHFEGPPEAEGVVDLLDAEGDVIRSDDLVTGSLTVSADGTVLAYGRLDGSVVAVPWDGAEVEVSAAGQIESPEIAGVVGSETCELDEAESCAVYGSSGAGGSFVATTSGQSGELDGLLSVADVGPDGQLSGVVKLNDDTSTCSAVRDREGTELWRTCDYSVTKFSPDGRFVIGEPAYESGQGDPSLAILDATTGKPVVTYAAGRDSQAYVFDSQWESDGTVLATVHDKGGFALLRMTLDGELTNVSGALNGGSDDFISPLVLPARG